MNNSPRKKPRHRFIEFTDQYGSYATMEVGCVTGGESYRVLKHVKRLVEAKRTGKLPETATLKWLDTDGLRYAKQLAKLRLVRFTVK